MIVNQLMPAAHRGGAVGDSARVMRTVLRAHGHRSEIFSLEIDEDMRSGVRPLSDPSAASGDVTVLHLATSSPLSLAFRRLERGRVIQYHNITPARFFAPFTSEMARLLTEARRELASHVDITDLAVGPSEYNRRQLEALGFRQTGVLPLAVDTGRLTAMPGQPAIEHGLRDGLTNLLFVGRVAPNRKIEDLIRLAEHYRRLVDAHCRLLVVGRDDSVPAYTAALHALAVELRWPPGRLVFTGLVPDEELATH